MIDKAVKPTALPTEQGKAVDKTKIYKFKYFHVIQKWWEKFWRILFIFVTIIMLALSNKIYLFHTLDEFKHVKKGNLMHFVLYSLPFAFIYIGVDYLIHSIFDDWVEKNYLRQDKYTQITMRKKKSRVIVRWGFNIFYYTVTSVIGYMLIKNTSFLPPFLGGHGSVFTLAQTRYLQQATFGMEVLYFIQFGKHVGRYFCHAFIQPEGSYYQYMLHHSLATFLILFSYAMDLWVVGIFVLIVHDGSDVFLAMTRMYRQYRNRKQFILSCGYISVVISWIGLRIISFGYCAVFACWYQYFHQIHILSAIEQQVFSFPYIFMSFMNTLLLFMHIYWTYYIIQSFISSNVSEKIARHSYD